MLTEDAELARLLEAYGWAEYELGTYPSNRRYDRQQESRSALLDYLATAYIRRTPDTTAEQELDPPLVTGPLSRTPVTVRFAGRNIGGWRPGDPLPEETVRRIVEGE